MNQFNRPISDRWWYGLEPLIITSSQTIRAAARANAGAGDGAVMTAGVTLEGLRRFAAGQTRLFAELFEAKSALLQHSAEYPKEYVLGVTFGQIAHDLGVLQRCAGQRLDAVNGPAARATLRLADQYGYHQALAPASAAGLVEETAVLCYFQKSAFVRVLPYAPVALIGIPYTTVNVTRHQHEHQTPSLGTERFLGSHAIVDFAAIAHEIGHYVFWHAVVPGTRRGLREHLAAAATNHSAWLADRAEELFADVYGCLIAGLVHGVAFLEMHSHNDPRTIAVDAPGYPAAALRPAAYVHTLNRLGCTYAASQIDGMWRAWLSARQVTPDAEKIAALTAFVDEIVALLGGDSAEWPAATASNNQRVSDPEGGVVDSGFVQRMMQTQLRHAARLGPAPSLQLVNDCPHGQQCVWSLVQGEDALRLGAFWRVKQGPTTILGEGTLVTPGIQVLDDLAHGSAVLPLSAEKWKDIFLMNGWVTGGSETVPIIGG